MLYENNGMQSALRDWMIDGIEGVGMTNYEKQARRCTALSIH